MHSCLPGTAAFWREECNLSTFLPPVIVQQQSFASAHQRPCEKAPKHNLFQPIWWQGKKNPFPLSQKKLTQRSQRLTGCTAVPWSINENQWFPSKNGGLWGSMTHALLYEIWKTTNDLSESFLTCLINSQEKLRTLPSGRQSYKVCILEMEYFCFKELTCGQAQWHQGMPSPLKQYRSTYHFLFLLHW